MKIQELLAQILFIGSSILLIFASAYTFNGLSSHNPSTKLENTMRFLKWGFIPFTILNGIRHIMLPGTIMGNPTPASNFFEMEAGGANIAAGVGSLVTVFAHTNSTCMQTYAIPVYIFAAYLTIALIASAVYSRNWKGMIAFPFLIGLLIYIAYQIQNNKAA
jgi:hypothetical protein